LFITHVNKLLFSAILSVERRALMCTFLHATAYVFTQFT
jgi:hypothetical protein